VTAIGPLRLLVIEQAHLREVGAAIPESALKPLSLKNPRCHGSRAGGSHRWYLHEKEGK